MIIKRVSGKSVSALGFLLTVLMTGLSPASVNASTVGLPDADNPGAGHGRAGNSLLFADVEFPPVPRDSDSIMLPAIGNPGQGLGRPEFVPANPGMRHGRAGRMPPVNPPVDTPAFDKGLVNAPAIMPPSVPFDTLPGSGFGQEQVVVPVPAAAWLFASGLLGLIGMARRRKQ
jgi:hypothetical protein